MIGRLRRRSAVRFEESLPLRLAVLLTTLWGYLSLGIAGGLLPIALGAGLLTCAGHWASWRQHGATSSRRTLLLGLALAGVVGWVLFDLSTGLAGGRLPQAQLGMLVQAVTSFDLRTRRNLYVTVLHTTPIMYLASNFGFSLFFAVLLAGYGAGVAAVFLAATLEDRRRDSAPFCPGRAAGGWVFWSGFALTSLALTAVLTVALPRPSGSQVLSPLTLTLPFSAPAQPELVEPLVPFIQLGAGGGTGGLEPRVDLTYRGQFNESVAFYVRSAVGSYWRGLAFDEYTGREWTSTSRDTPVPRDPRGRYDIGAPQLGDPPSYVQTFYVMRDQSEVIPVGYDQQVIIFRGEAPQLNITEDGSIKRTDPLRAGNSYSVLSTTPAPYRGSFGPRYWSRDLSRYWRVPNHNPRIAALTQQVTRGQRSSLARAQAIETYLRETYPYSLDIAPLPKGADAVEQFLFVDRSGFCTQFASAMVVMLRHLGVPARLVSGFGPGEYNAFSGLYTVRASDAHAWVEVWANGVGWVPFDPTPRYDGIERQRDGGPLSAALLDSPFLGELQGLMVGSVLGLGAGLAGLLAPLLTAALVAVLLVGVGWVLRRRGLVLPWRRPPPSDRERVLDAYRRARRRVEGWTEADRRPSLTPAEFLMLAPARTAAGAAAFATLTHLAESAAFDPTDLPPDAVLRARAAQRNLERRRWLPWRN